MSTLRTRIVAFLLAVSMLGGYALPAAAEEVQPGVEIAAEAEPTAAPDPQPQPEPLGETPTEAPAEAPTEAPTEPENTEPEVTEPQEIQAPETTEPEVTEPEVTEPEETEPEETEPEVTEPEETEPERELAYPDPTLYYAAPVEERLVYGMNIVHPGTYDGCWDFPINSVTAVRYGGTLYATMHVGVAAAYRYLYFGSKAELEARLAQGGPFPVVDAVGNNGELLFHFTTGAADNSRLTLCLVAADDSQELGYRVEERELIIPAVPEEAMVALFAAAPVTASVIAAGAYAAAPEDAQEQEAPGLLVAEKDQSTACAQFNITSATALAMDGTVYITLRVAPQEDKTYAYSYLYLDDADSLTALMDADETVTAVLGVENNEDPENPCRVYHFTLSAGKLEETNYRVPVCLLKDDLIAEDAYAPMDLIVPTQLPTPAAPAPADDVPEQEDEPEEQDQENQDQENQGQENQDQEQEGEPEEQEQEEPPVTAVPKAAQYDTAPVAEKDITGLTVVDGAGAALADFAVASATGINANGQLYLTLQVTPAAEDPYIYLFLGDKTALDAKLAAEGEFSVVGCDTVEGTQSYHFTLSADQVGSLVSVCLLKQDLSYAEAKLTIPEGIPLGKLELTPVSDDTKAGSQDEFAAPDLANELFIAQQGTNVPYPGFKCTVTTAVVKDSTAYVTIYEDPISGTKYAYSYLYFGTLEDLENQFIQGGELKVIQGENVKYNNKNKRAYKFTLPVTDTERRIPVCILKADVNAEGAYNTEELELVIPANLPNGTTFEKTNYGSAPAKEQAVSGLFVTNPAKPDDDGNLASYTLFNIKSATAVKDNEKIYVTVNVAPSNAKGEFNYPYMHFGTLTDLKAHLRNGGPLSVVEKEADRVVVGGVECQTYHFTLPATAAGTQVPVCILKDDLKKSSPYNSSELLLIVPDNIPEVPAPDPKNVTMQDEFAAPDLASELFIAQQGTSVPYSGFKCTVTTAVVKDSTAYVTIYEDPVSGTKYTYSYLYFGTLEDLENQFAQGGKFEVIQGKNVKYNNKNKRAYEFTLSVTDTERRIPVCILKADVNAEGAYNAEELELVVPANLPNGTTFEKTNYGSAPAKEQAVSGLFVTNPAKPDDDGNLVSYTLFNVKSATAIKDSKNIYVTVNVAPSNAKGEFNYPYMHFGTLTDLKAHLRNGGPLSVVEKEADRVVVGGVECQTYHFTLPATAAGTQVPVCILKDDLKKSSPYNSSELLLIVPDNIPEAEPVQAPTIPPLPDDLEEAKIKVIKADGTEFKMFAAAKTGIVVVGDKIQVRFETKNTSYDRLYFGVKEDGYKSPYVQGVARDGGGWVFEFELPASYQGAKNPICLGNSDGAWYEKANLWISIPGKTTLDDAGMKMIAGGSEVEQMFVITASSATLKGNTITCTVTGKAAGSSGKVADKLYLGDRFDSPKKPYVTGTVNGDGTTTFVFDVPADKQGTSIPVVIGHTTGTWDTTQDYFLNIPNFDSTFDLSYYTDGVYDIYGNAYAELSRTQNKAFPVDKGSTLTISGDTATIKWVCRSKSYDKLYFGSVSDEAAMDAGAVKIQNYTENKDTLDYKVYLITLPKSALGERIPFVRHNSSGWWTVQDYLILANCLPKTSTTPVDPTDPTDPTTPTDPTDPSEPSGEIKDGYYQVTTECSASMFKIIDAKLKVVNGKMTAELTLSGTGYDYLYAGTKEQAAKDKANWAPFTKNAEGKYVYTVPVSALDEPLNFASHSIKNDEWYDRVVTFLSASLKKIGDVDPTDPTDPTTPTTPTEPTTPTDPTTPTSPSEPDTNGSTSAVNSATTLKDGEYKPDGFTFSGGTGKTRIVCDKVIVKGGKAYAVIHFESTTGNPSAYKYVKASGNVYYPTADGKFTIPVALNANNRILGLTTKMSAAHEIEYTIYIQLKKAQSTTSTGSGGGGSLSTEEEEKDDPNSKLDKTAPEILGLEFKENIKTSGARYLKLFQYDQGVVLAEVDLRRDTVLDTDEAVQALAQADKEAKEAAQSQTIQSDEPADTAQITSDYVAAQYQGDILKYLLVPAGVELPAGLEKDYLIVSVPASNVYLMDETLAGTLDQLGALKNVSVLPEDCEDAELYDMLETGEKLPGGTWEKPDYRTLIKEKVALGLIGTEPLPLSEQALAERKETVPEREELTAVEYRDRLTKLTDRFAVLDIPLVVDRSADEPEARGQAAWLKLYGILFGKQDAAGKLYDAAIAKEDNA